MVATGQRLPRSSGEVVVHREHYPALAQSASDASRRGQTWYRRLITANMVLLVAGAALSAIVENVFDWHADHTSVSYTILTLLIVLTLLSAMATNFINWHRKDDADWFEGRAVAESVKTATWRYMMRAEPFTADAESDREFLQRLKATFGDCRELRQELGAMPADARQITPRMREVRRLGVMKRTDVYVRERLNRQIEWYHGKARLNGRLAERWFWASFAAEFVALVMALLPFLTSYSVSLVGVFAAIAVAFTAWTQLGRHNELNKSYGLAWQELLAIKETARTANTEQELQDLVRAGEDAISREHTMWVVKHA